ncbi:unnamed protein product [Sympodiomycopsis kandeliae]
MAARRGWMLDLWSLAPDGAFVSGPRHSACQVDSLVKSAQDADDWSDRKWESLHGDVLEHAGEVDIIQLTTTSALAITCFDAGLVKYGPYWRLQLLELLDLVNLKIRIAEALLLKNPSQFYEVKKQVEDVSTATGLQAAIDSAKQSLSQERSLVLSIRSIQGFMRSEAAKSPEVQAHRVAAGKALVSANAKRPKTTSPRDEQLTGILSQLDGRLYPGRDEDSSVKRVRLSEEAESQARFAELQKLNWVPKDCNTLEEWIVWFNNLPNDVCIWRKAVGSRSPNDTMSKALRTANNPRAQKTGALSREDWPKEFNGDVVDYFESHPPDSLVFYRCSNLHQPEDHSPAASSRLR